MGWKEPRSQTHDHGCAKKRVCAGEKLGQIDLRVKVGAQTWACIKDSCLCTHFSRGTSSPRLSHICFSLGSSLIWTNGCRQKPVCPQRNLPAALSATNASQLCDLPPPTPSPCSHRLSGICACQRGCGWFTSSPGPGWPRDSSWYAMWCLLSGAPCCWTLTQPKKASGAQKKAQHFHASLFPCKTYAATW